MDDGWMGDGWMLPPDLWAMEAAGTGRGGAGAGGEFGMLSASCPPLFPSCADRKENGDYLGVVQICPGKRRSRCEQRF